MESLDYWRLCDELSVIQAALLIAGEDPSSSSFYVETWDFDKRPVGYEAAKTAIINAITGKRLPASVRYSVREPSSSYDEPTYDEEVRHDKHDNQVYITKHPDLTLTTVQVADLRSWLLGRGLKTGFFFPLGAEEKPGYLSKENPFYANKLAAAMQAWKAVSENPALIKGKTPKQAIEKWLREHASEYGLTKDDGNPNEQGIEEVAKVANWKPGGGVAKTPGNEA